MSQNIILEVYQLVKNGVALEDAIPEGADPALWRKLISGYNPDAKRVKHSGHNGRPRKRSHYAAQVLAQGRAMGELVGRMNGNDIPFDGSAPADSGDESSEAARLGLKPEA